MARPNIRLRQTINPTQAQSFHEAPPQTGGHSPQAPHKSVNFRIQYMRGGGCNRIAAIEVMDSQDNDLEARMVLRVPRNGVPHSDQDVINLQFVQEHLPTVPRPEIIAHDSSESNPLNNPYIIQKRIPGHNMESQTRSYPYLNHQQKLAFAGKIKKSDKGFMICPLNVFLEAEPLLAGRAEAIPIFRPTPFGVATHTMTKNDATADEQTPLGFYLVPFARWHSTDLGLVFAEMWQPSIYQRLINMATEMWYASCLDHDSYRLNHYNLDPRNIIQEQEEGKDGDEKGDGDE